jgi:hypothetical protein
VAPIVKSRQGSSGTPAAFLPDPRRLGEVPSGWLDAGTFAACVLFLFGGIGRAGLWESVELDLAEKARTAVDGGAAARAVALGFRLFGVSATGGRVVLAGCVLAGALAIFAVCACLEDAATARVAALLFASTPMIFVHARTLRPDALSMGALAVAFAGLGMAALDERASLGKRVPSFLVGLLGLAGGYATEGPWLGVAAPSVAVGLAWMLGRGDARQRGAVFGVLALLVGLAAFGIGWRGAANVAHLPFDHALAEVAHGCFPWSALLPLALASASSRPLSRAAWLFATALFAAQSWLQRGDVLPVAFALVLATAFAKERSPRPWSRIALAAVVACAVLLVEDFRHLPEKDLAAYGTSLAELPSAAKALAERGYTIAAALVAVAAIVSAYRVRSQRAWVFGGTLVAAIFLRFGFFASVASVASPKGAFDSYARLHAPAEPLGLLGIKATTALYAGAGVATELASSADADAWLRGGETRRFLALRRTELPALNASYRGAFGRNLPVVEARSSDALLAVSRLAPGEVSESPLDAVVLAGAPAGLAGGHVTFGDALELLGYDVVDDEKNPSTLSATRSRHLRLYFRVLRAFGGGHCTFVHLDRSPARFSEEHREWAAYPMPFWRAGDVLVDDYAVRLPPAFRGGGDHPLYVGVGVLPCSDDRRMPITAGANDGHDRAELGKVHVE